jgi:hypothetical protein
VCVCVSECERVCESESESRTPIAGEGWRIRLLAQPKHPRGWRLPSTATQHLTILQHFSRAAVFDRSGKVLGMHSSAYSTRFPEPG